MTFHRSIWFKRIPLYVSCVVFCTMFIRGLMPSSHSPIILKVLGVLGLLLFGVGGIIFLISDLRMLITGRRPVGVDSNGLWVERQFIPWERISEFHIGNDSELQKVIHIVTVDAQDEIQSIRNPFERFFTKMKFKKDKAIYTIDYEDYSGKAEDFVAYLEEQRQEYGKK